ncbi:HlyD family type I secretion periplasmic adaptor subunit [Marivibrio halodurans]|uniref:Membrane fusion protein (MFP) family protein n=1 Tax=Marivibrio halodurans TaxID=2039722 RepID=A0A8J7RVP5_9PROT|nr:HlyD family type I secretion periplasmic adaptor subunit [Marivibrio halodurans]MBP5855410.1 HlyD family type I secretion periplasmic adaptor subunit [Marivibrio halodurans]
MATLDDIVARYPAPRFQPLAWLLMGLLVATGLWAWQAKLDTVAVAQGTVVPQGEIKVVQHLEGGVVQAIFVREGTVVEAGQPLLQLDLSTSATNTEELEVRLDGLVLKRARLESEAAGEPLSFPEDVAVRRPVLSAAERRTHESRLDNLEGKVRVLEQQAEQRALEINELNVRRRSVSNDLSLARERYDLSQPLLASKLVTRIELNEIARDVQRLEGELASIDAGLPRARAALEEVEEKLASARQEFRTDASGQLSEVELEIRRQEKLLDRARSEAGRMEIASPIDGVVKTLVHNTVGGVVRPGEPIMEIVPTQDRLVVDARIDPIDIGHIAEGMPATVKITTYDFVRYGGLEGTVTAVGADIEQDEQGKQFFKAEIETAHSYLERDGLTYPIHPGMQATVDIHLGDKTVLDFLIQPVLKMRYEAFRER